MIQTIQPGGSAAGKISIPGDKSISIRAVLFGSIADGTSSIAGLGTGGDIRSAVSCVRQLGIEVEQVRDETILIHGRGLRGYGMADGPVDCGNSGTTMRLLSGILTGQKHAFELTGDDSLRKRPMKRIIDPLAAMGAGISGTGDGNCAPLRIRPASLQGTTYALPVASAQVKSAILLAGLYAEGETTVIEPAPCRNHTELMLAAQGARLETDSNRITVEPSDRLTPLKIEVPGDISGAAFFLVLGAILPGSDILIENVGMNPTRAGIVEVLRRMGARIDVFNERIAGGEPAADLRIVHAPLHGIEIGGGDIPVIIDELPAISVAAAFADGETAIRDASELRVKETDRIAAVCENLRRMDVDVEEFRDGMRITGGNGLNGAYVESYGDHRIAMAFAVGATAANGTSTISGAEWADISFPGFFTLLESIRN